MGYDFRVNMAIQGKPIVVVGAGLFGLTIAERIASELGREVIILERRSHIGGNAHSFFDSATGIEVHKYGSHLFHTDNLKIWDYVNRFTKFNNYKHKVWAKHQGKLFPMPINLATISLFCEKFMTPMEAKEWIASKRKPDPENPKNFEDKAIQLIGEPLYRAFIAGYTEKQWQVEPKQLPAEIISRLPVRYNFNLDYFDDNFQGLPINGYMHWFSEMINNPLIKIETETDFFNKKDKYLSDHLIVYTGPIDRFFDYKFGPLSWRTLDFEWENVQTDDYQGTAVVNYSDIDVGFTRIHEFRHLHPERKYTSTNTVIAREFSRFAVEDDEPYYPVNTEEDRYILEKYRSLKASPKNVLFGGRLGSYQYLDMHMAIGSALSMFSQKIAPMFKEGN
jgi:UDP-galactopyranose mutase